VAALRGQSFYRPEFVLPITSGFLLAATVILKLAVDRYIAHSRPARARYCCLLYGGALIGEFLFFLLAVYATMLVAQESLADLRRGFIRASAEIAGEFFRAQSVGAFGDALTPMWMRLTKPLRLAR